MKNHEAYFTQFEGGAKEISEDSELFKSCSYLWGSWEGFLAQFKATAMTRGVGWAMLSLDRKAQRLLISWVDEQHQGQLPNTEIILGLDMWEHSYMLDYPPSEKKKYVEAFFKNLNWEVVANRI
jgi:superoxide dismutase, Fe-Mn family